MDSSARQFAFDKLKEYPSSYLAHYIKLTEKYENHHDIYKFYSDQIKDKILTYADQGKYKYDIYLKINPNLEPTSFIQCMHPISKDIIRFRLGSHNLPIEKGRWNRTLRELRVCSNCNVLGDEEHVLFHCTLIDRTDLNLSNELNHIWKQQDVFTLFKRIKMAEFL